MSECCNPAGYGRFFDEKEARRNLRRYEKKGLDPLVRGMVDFVTGRGMEGRSVLEAGGGIGALQVELLEAGAERAVNVELSEGYESVAADLLRREGLGGRAVRHLGDFTDVASGLEADDVILNRVICCYPHMERLMGAALSASRRFVAAIFPRDHLVSRASISLENAYFRLRGLDFRAYVHPPDQIVATAATSGFEVVYRDQTFIWRAVVFERVA